jgi:hypothetical protein
MVGIYDLRFAIYDFQILKVCRIKSGVEEIKKRNPGGAEAIQSD